ncbi:MAG: dihydrofolate reductase [Rhizobacter sp.]|nr:dihydrofolate reductase [Ferruginibacter sp.]
MPKVFVSISMSLDGFIAGPGITAQQPMGEGGERLHDWLFKTRTEADKAIVEETFKAGAVIVGGRTYKIAINDAWEGRSPFDVTSFVLTHEIPAEQVKGFVFVTAGIESILEQAKTAAGEKDVWVMGGADIIQQFIHLKLVDEIQITLVNVLLGKGTLLFEHIAMRQVELERIRIIESAGVTHIKYRIVQ